MLRKSLLVSVKMCSPHLVEVGSAFAKEVRDMFVCVSVVIPCTISSVPSIAATQETSGRLLVGGTVGPIRPTPVDNESREEEDDIFIEVSVSSPHKMGEGMSSYLAYKVSRKCSS